MPWYGSRNTNMPWVGLTKVFCFAIIPTDFPCSHERTPRPSIFNPKPQAVHVSCQQGVAFFFSMSSCHTLHPEPPEIVGVMFFSHPSFASTVTSSRKLAPCPKFFSLSQEGLQRTVEWYRRATRGAGPGCMSRKGIKIIRREAVCFHIGIYLSTSANDSPAMGMHPAVFSWYTLLGKSRCSALNPRP